MSSLINYRTYTTHAPSWFTQWRRHQELLPGGAWALYKGQKEKFIDFDRFVFVVYVLIWLHRSNTISIASPSWKLFPFVNADSSESLVSAWFSHHIDAFWHQGTCTRKKVPLEKTEVLFCLQLSFSWIHIAIVFLMLDVSSVTYLIVCITFKHILMLKFLV